MLDIVVCFKWVIDEAYIRRTASGGLDFSSVDYKISEYDRNAIEAAVRLREIHGGAVTAITVAPPEASKGVKDALSRGPDRAIFVSDPAFKELDAFQTASILGEVIRVKSKFNLILCGEGSGDSYAQQVGPRLAGILSIPCVAYVQRLDIENERIIAERKAGDFTEVLSIPMPALATVLPDIASPRIPGVKDTLMASKKPVETVVRGDLGGVPEAKMKTLGLTASKMERECELFTAEESDIARFVATLQKKGVLK